MHERATRRVAADFLRRLIDAVPYRIHTVLTERAIEGATGSSPMASGTHFTTPGNKASAAGDIREALARGELFRSHAFELACARTEIDHRLTKPNHPWTNGQVERMNRTLKEATVRRYHYETHDHLCAHLRTFLEAYNFAKRLKTLKGLTVFEFISSKWTSEPHRFKLHPDHLIPGLNT